MRRSPLPESLIPRSFVSLTVFPNSSGRASGTKRISSGSLSSIVVPPRDNPDTAPGILAHVSGKSGLFQRNRGR